MSKKVVKAPSADALKQQLAEFKDFIKKQGLIGMATGLIIGGAAATLVKSAIDNVIMPPLGLLLGSTDGLKGLYFNMVVGDKTAKLGYGIFLNDLLNFVVIAAVVYMIIIFVQKFLGEDHVSK